MKALCAAVTLMWKNKLLFYSTPFSFRRHFRPKRFVSRTKTAFLCYGLFLEYLKLFHSTRGRSCYRNYSDFALNKTDQQINTRHGKWQDWRWIFSVHLFALSVYFSSTSLLSLFSYNFENRAILFLLTTSEGSNESSHFGETFSSLPKMHQECVTLWPNALIVFRPQQFSLFRWKEETAISKRFILCIWRRLIRKSTPGSHSGSHQTPCRQMELE